MVIIVENHVCKISSSSNIWKIAWVNGILKSNMGNNSYLGEVISNLGGLSNKPSLSLFTSIVFWLNDTAVGMRLKPYTHVLKHFKIKGPEKWF